MGRKNGGPTAPPTRRVGKHPAPATRTVSSPDLAALGLDVLDIVRADGSPATDEDLIAADPPGPLQGQITITVADADAFLTAFASVFGYQDVVREVLDPRKMIPNPMSRSDFAVAILREYVAQVMNLAAQRGKNP